MFFLESLWVAILVAVVGSLFITIKGTIDIAGKVKDE